MFVSNTPAVRDYGRAVPEDGATCLATHCFCELVRHDGLAQPANAWSSLAGPRVAGAAAAAAWLHLGLGLLLTAYVLWVLDQWSILCDPASWLQGHAAWHVLGAAAGWCLARH
ncbi:hypothetical protein ACFQU3_17530 [Terrabacter sp. GCM10028922]|uniref:hypothetical protein n=1 Tax=Terrabacter sp. GCM10028922 TaxID=3273428 RepID=UPI00361EE87A